MVFNNFVKQVKKFIEIVNKSPKMWTMKKNLTIFCLCVVLLSIAQVANGQDKFVRRNSFNLGVNVITAKFSPDYTLLAVLRQGENKLFSYNPMTFELIGDADLQPGTTPFDFQIFGNDIIVATRSNILLVYERKPHSAELTLKQKITLKTYGGIQGMKLQKLTEDFNDKSQASSTRHLVIWSIFSDSIFQVYKYVASQQTNKLTFLFSKVYESSSTYFTDFQFFDEKFLVFGRRQSATVGETFLLELSNTSKIVKVDSKVVSSMKSFNLKPTGSFSTSNYLAITHANEASQFRAKGKTIQEGGKQISSITWGKAFSDNNRMIGFFNHSSIYVYRDSQLFYETYPTYTAKLQQNNITGLGSLYIVAMPQNNTGQLIANHCYENEQPCFYYYSLCGPNTYYTTNALGNEVCKKCTSDSNCEKCINDACVKCNNGFYFNQSKKCQTCSLAITGCTSCSQDGKLCHACDIKQFQKDPVDNVCMCIKGTVWDMTLKKCVQCSSKVENCAECLLIQNTSYQCTKCGTGLNRIPSNDGKSCVCDSFYFENTTKQCQSCDPYQKCMTCTASNNCQLCDATQKWTLNAQAKCECMLNYVQVNNKCLLCGVLGCKTCQTQNKCKACQDGFKLDETQQCVCNEDRFLNEAKKQCQLCSKYMTGCYQCSSSTQCDVCDIKQHRQPSPSAEGKCLCKSQYTENSKRECVLCTTPGCLNCEGENYCTTCNIEKGFVANPVNGKCQCLSTKYLDSDSGTCKECSSSITGCQSCDNNSTCKTCNSTASFDSVPQNGSCKCVSNFFVSENECLQCQVICEHCNKCVIIVGQEMLLTSTSVGCAQCQDGFQVKNSRCVQKTSDVGMIVGISIGVVVILSIVFGCWIRKRNKRKQQQKMRQSRQQNSSIVKMLLKQNSSEVITMDRTQSGKNNSNYENMFSGNINYSISSQERQIDKRSFNETMKEIERQRQREFEKKNKGNSYSQLSKNMRESKKIPPTQQEILSKQKQSLFGHRGKG